MKLSILMLTIPERGEKFTRVYNELMRQLEYCRTVHPTLGMVEVLIDGSKRFTEGGLSIGKKREALVKRASGKYLCFLDDDDMISGNYLETLLRLCQHDVDVVTFRNFSRLETFWMIVDMSLQHNGNDQASPDAIVNRRPWHICPVRSLFAKMHDFPDTNYGEDWHWFEQVLKHCVTEKKTNAILHEYHHGSHSEADRITELLPEQGATGNH